MFEAICIKLFPVSASKSTTPPVEFSLVALAVPFTCSAVAGLVVPIPTKRLFLINNPVPAFVYVAKEYVVLAFALVSIYTP